MSRQEAAAAGEAHCCHKSFCCHIFAFLLGVALTHLPLYRACSLSRPFHRRSSLSQRQTFLQPRPCPRRRH
jgi:hypothetical protein